MIKKIFFTYLIVTEREIFHPLVCVSNGYSRQGRARLKPEACVSCVGLLCGPPMWISCMGLLCGLLSGSPVWVSRVGLLHGSPAWVFCVGLRGFKHWTVCGCFS